MKHLAYSPEQAEATRKRGDWQVIKSLMPFLWPARDVSDALEIRFRVVFALICIIAAKVATVYAPIYLKHAVDALSLDVTPEAAIAVPLALILA